MTLKLIEPISPPASADGVAVAVVMDVETRASFRVEYDPRSMTLVCVDKLTRNGTRKGRVSPDMQAEVWIDFQACQRRERARERRAAKKEKERAE